MADINGIHYPLGSDTYDLPADWLEHAQTDAQQATDAAAAVAYARAPLTQSAHLNSLEPGAHIRIGTFTTANGYPFDGSGFAVVDVAYNDGTNGAQRITMTNNDGVRWGDYTRHRVSGTWTPWRSRDWLNLAQITTAAQLDGLYASGDSGIRVVSSSFREAAGIPVGDGKSGWVETVFISTTAVAQLFTSTGGESYIRVWGGPSTSWGAWEGLGHAPWFNLAPITTAAQLDELYASGDSGIRVVSSSFREAAGIPVGDGKSGWVETVFISTTAVAQTFTSTGGESYIRVWGGPSTSWGAWEGVGHAKGIVASGTDLDTVIRAGDYSTRRVWPVLNHPANNDYNYALEVKVIGQGNILQRMTSDHPDALVTYQRVYNGTSWYPWELAGASSGAWPVYSKMEQTGSWSSRASGFEFTAAIGQHRSVTRQVIGQSADGWPMEALIFGDPTNPAILVVASQHGNEPGPREGAMLWARDLAQPRDLMTNDLCVVLVVTANPDGILVRRHNGNNEDTNRDWVVRTQPEVQAITGLVGDFNFVAAVDVHNGGYPNEISLQGPTGADPDVTDLSTDLYNATQAGLEDHGHLVRHYDPPAVGMFQHGMAIVDRIPSILVEIPGGYFQGSGWDWYVKDPYYQAHASRLSMDIFAHYVWDNLATFTAL